MFFVIVSIQIAVISVWFTKFFKDRFSLLRDVKSETL